MANPLALQGTHSEFEVHRTQPAPRASTSEPPVISSINTTLKGVEILLTTNEACQVLKIHPKVLERMAKRGDVPALKVGKFWRYRATALDAWINSRLQSDRQPCCTDSF